MSKIDEIVADVVKNFDDKEIDKLIAKLKKNKHNPIVWTNNNTILNEYSIRGDKNYFKLKVAKNNETNLKYMRMTRFGASVSINTRTEFTKLMTYLKTGAMNLGWYDAEDVDILKNLDDYIIKYKDEHEKIGGLRNTISGLRERIINMDLSKFEDALKEFHDMYTNKHKEEDLQKFLEQNMWLLGDEYVYQQPISFSQFPLWTSKLDFFVKRFDGFYDIVEIKKADAKLFCGLDKTENKLLTPTRESPMSGDLKDAISQIINYLEQTNTLGDALHKLNENIKIHKPRGYIIIGRDNVKYKDAITTINDYLNNIEILTYDRLYEKAEGFVTRIKKGHI